MLYKRIAVYLAVAGILASIILVRQLNSEQPWPVPPVAPAENPYQSTISASGIIESIDENVAIGVPVSGLVTNVHVKVWDKVEAGQPLFELDNRDLKAQLLVQKANLQVSRAHLARLIEQLSRWKSVADRRAVSVDDVRSRENEVRVARTQVALAQSQADQTEILIDRLIIRAPKPGIILQSGVRPGEYAALMPVQSLMVLGNLDHLQVRADIDEQNASRIRIGLDAVAYVKGERSRSIPLTFVRIEPLVIPKRSLTGSYDERVDTRVLQVIYSIDGAVGGAAAFYVGQQVDVFISDAKTKQIDKVPVAETGVSEVKNKS